MFGEKVNKNYGSMKMCEFKLYYIICKFKFFSLLFGSNIFLQFITLKCTKKWGSKKREGASRLYTAFTV